MEATKYKPDEMWAMIQHLAEKVKRMETDLYADGIQPGMIKKLEAFMTTESTRREQQKIAEEKRDEDIETRHRQNRYRMNWALGLLGILVPVALAILFKH